MRNGLYRLFENDFFVKVATMFVLMFSIPIFLGVIFSILIIVFFLSPLVLFTKVKRDEFDSRKIKLVF